ncbi:hypothetical protein PWT90_01416 [Aphanocladium album]|nr:hypothetical protein PWT90_01416 [Aphanocladium album]
MEADRAVQYSAILLAAFAAVALAIPAEERRGSILGGLVGGDRVVGENTPVGSNSNTKPADVLDLNKILGGL